jgi:tetratricopeptide (TPR) repeat protein
VGIYLHSGAWDRVETTLRRAVHLYQEVGDDDHSLEVQLDLAWVYLLQAKFAQARTEFDNTLAQGSTAAPRLQAIGLLGRAATQLDSELDLMPALADIDTALELIASLEFTLNTSLTSVAYGLRAVVYRRMGDYDTAFTWANTALHALNQNDLDTHFILEIAYAAICGTLLDVLEMNVGADRYAQPAQEACRALQKFAQIVSIARPRAWLEQSRYSALTGKTTKALRTIEVALTDAQQLNMPYHIGLAHALKGQMLPEGNPQRLDQLQQAAQYFATLGAQWHQQQVARTISQAK